MRTLSLGTKILGQMLIVIVLFLGALLYLFAQFSQEQVHIDAIAGTWVPRITLARAVQGNLWQLVADVRGQILYGQSGNYDTAHQNLILRLAQLQRLSRSGEAAKSYRLMAGQVTDAMQAIDGVYGESQSGHNGQAIRALRQIDPLLTRAAQSISGYVHMEDAAASGTIREQKAAANATRTVAIVVGAMATALGVLFALLVSAGLGRRLRRIASAAQRIADGDVCGQPLPTAGGDEVAALAAAFNKMQDDLGSVLREIEASSAQVARSSDEITLAVEQVAQATQQIAVSVQEVARGATEQSESAADTATVMVEFAQSVDRVRGGAQTQAGDLAQTGQLIGQMAQGVEQVARGAQEVASAAERALAAAETGASAVSRSAAGMHKIRSRSIEVAERMGELGASSQQIGDIVAVISGVAEQTNLLALNAAIEAARAGEHGRGFAVVADEVRKLAESSSRSAKDIGEIISGIQSNVQTVMQAIQQSSYEVEHGTELSQTAGEALESILSAMRETSASAQDISAAAEEVAASTEGAVRSVDDVAKVAEINRDASARMAEFSLQVTDAINSVAAISAQTAASAEELSATIEEVGSSAEEIASSVRSLSEAALGLNGLVGRFQLAGDETRQGGAEDAAAD